MDELPGWNEKSFPSSHFLLLFSLLFSSLAHHILQLCYMKNVIPFLILCSDTEDGKICWILKLTKNNNGSFIGDKATLIPQHHLCLLFCLGPSKSEKQESETVFDLSMSDCHSSRCLLTINWLVNAVQKSRAAPPPQKKFGYFYCLC